MTVTVIRACLAALGLEFPVLRVYVFYPFSVSLCVGGLFSVIGSHSVQKVCCSRGADTHARSQFASLGCILLSPGPLEEKQHGTTRVVRISSICVFYASYAWCPVTMTVTVTVGQWVY